MLAVPPMMLQSRNCRKYKYIWWCLVCVCIPALLCVKSHCVMLTMCALTLSPWLYSSGQTKASGVFFFSAKWYNLAAIFIAGNRLQKPVIHASRPSPHHAQGFCFTDFNVPK